MAMVNRPPPLRECPASPDSLHFATYWYRIPSIPDFHVCTNCYEDKVAHTRFASVFETFYHVPIPGKAATCMFNNMTMKQIFITALQSSYNDSRALAGLFGHANRRTQVKDCPGTDGATAEQGIRWYGTNQIQDLMVCEACYLDSVCGSTFMTNFTPYQISQHPDQIWICDMAVPSVKRHLRENSESFDWPAFVNAASHRLRLPKCDGSEQSLTQRNWYTPNAIPNVLICETCYMDEISMTPIMNQFGELRSRWTSTPPPHVTGRCSFAKLSIQICSNQLFKRDFDRWIQLVRHMRSLPPCAGDSIQDGDWFPLMNPRTRQATEFGLCESCYVGCIESSNNGHMFHRERTPGMRYCEFSSSNPRIGESVQRMTEVLFTGVTTKLIDYAVQLQAQSTQQPQTSGPLPHLQVQSFQQPPTSDPVVHQQMQSVQQPQTSGPVAQNPQRPASNWQAISAQMAQQHSMHMNMSSMVFNQNSMHNAAMSGMWNQGSSYNSYHDPTYTQAQYNYNQAQNGLYASMAGGRSRSVEPGQ